MKRRIAVIAAGIALAATVGAPLSASAAAQPTAVSHAFTCTKPGGEANVYGVDWLKVHTTPGTTTPAIGQLRDGAQFCVTGTTVPVRNGHPWQYGYGYNGSTKLTGWVAADYLIYP
jgi:hypothetical protein